MVNHTVNNSKHIKIIRLFEEKTERQTLYITWQFSHLFLGKGFGKGGPTPKCGLQGSLVVNGGFCCRPPLGTKTNKKLTLTSAPESIALSHLFRTMEFSRVWTLIKFYF